MGKNRMVLVTGANGFIGRNLVARLGTMNAVEIEEYDIGSKPSLLHEHTKYCDFVFHLAGVNRPREAREYMDGNYGLTKSLVASLQAHGNSCPVLLSSSIQAEIDNPYGGSKRAAEEALFLHAAETGAQALVYRLPNVFGKWCRPNYNSAVATFCHNISRDLPITVSDPATTLNLVYIDDVVKEFLRALKGQANKQGQFCYVPEVSTVSLGRVVDLLKSFRHSSDNRQVPNMSDDFSKKLYATYLSYLPEEAFVYPLKMNTDSRGSFTEFLRTPDRGQVSINVSKPGIVRGNHWHNTKNEKFLVVSGKGVVRFRRVGSDKVIEYYVSGDKLEVIDVPPGYTHNIENLGDNDMVTVMWANECYDPNEPDTYYLEVNNDQ